MSENVAAQKIPESLGESIRTARRVVLATHVSPDGDAYGSVFALATILEQEGKEVVCYFDEPVSPLYAFLPLPSRIVTDIAEVADFRCGDAASVTVALDTGDSARLGRHEQELLADTMVLVIDHHRSHKDFGNYRWVDATSSSTGELVYLLAKQLGYQISLDAALNLWVAICTDTGSFRYENTSPQTLRIAADLVEQGVHPDRVAYKIYDNMTLSRLHLLQKVLQTLEMHADDQIGVLHVTAAMLDEAGAVVDDLEGLIDYPRSLKSVAVAVFVKAIAEDVVSVSLRAKGRYDVAAIAEKFGGGGHRNAAGCRFRDKGLAEVKALVVDEIRCLLVAQKSE